MENDKIFELMTKMYAEMQMMNKRLGNVETDTKDLKTSVSGLNADVKDLKTDVNSLKSDAKVLKSDTAKNSIMLEKMSNNIKLLAEGQESFRDQIGRSNKNDKRSVNDRLDVIELAVTSTSHSVSNINDTIDVLKNTTANNDIDIKILKKQRRSTI